MASHIRPKQPDIVDVADQRNEVWDQIDGTARTSSHEDTQSLRIASRLRVLSRKPERHAVTLDSPGQAFKLAPVTMKFAVRSNGVFCLNTITATTAQCLCTALARPW